MKAKKMIAILVFCLISALVFAGCGNKNKPVENNTSTIESQTSKDSKDSKDNKDDKEKETETTTKKEEETTKKDSSPDRPGNVTPQQQEQQQPTTKKQEETTQKPTESANPEEQVTEQEGQADAHKHSYTARVTREATCTSQGVRTYSCDCGDSYTEFIPMTGHNIVGSIIQNPTCGTTGIMSYDCSVCGHHDHSESLAPTGDHSWTPVYRMESRTSYVCSCGEAFDSRDAWAAHSNAAGSGHGSCSTKTYSVQTGDIDHYECSVCGQIQ